MGRLYGGDIEGKMAFGVQSSDDADFFGVCGTQPEILEYYYSEGDLGEVETQLEECEKELGEDKDKINKYFEDKDSYNYTIMSKFFNISEIEIRRLLEWYFRYGLGIKIRDCIKENGECSFSVEC